jgi:hypothetical protein
MKEQFKKTMGTLNLKVSQKAVFNEALRKRITDATTRRTSWPTTIGAKQARN